MRVFLDHSHLTVDELAGTVTFDVSLSRTSASDTTVEWRTVDGWARIGRDFAGTSAEVTIPSGELSATIEISILDDELVEPDEAFLVEITRVSSGEARLGTPVVCEVVIADDEPPAIGFVEASFRAVENSGQAEIQVELNKTLDSAVQVDYSVAAGTAVDGEDFESQVGTLTIAEGETEVHFFVTLLDDQVEEADETILLTLSNPSPVVLGTIDTATLIVRDDDGVPSIAFSSSTVQVEEDVGTALIEVVVSGNNLQDIDVSVSADGGSALLGEDFSAPPALITIPAGQYHAVIPVPIIADGLPENDESLVLTLSDPVHATLGEPRTALSPSWATSLNRGSDCHLPPSRLANILVRCRCNWYSTVNNPARSVFV